MLCACVVFLEVHVYMCAFGRQKESPVELESSSILQRPWSCLPDAGIIGDCHSCSAFMWVFGIQAPFLMCIEQMLYLLSHFLTPKNFLMVLVMLPNTFLSAVLPSFFFTVSIILLWCFSEKTQVAFVGILLLAMKAWENNLTFSHKCIW